MDLLDRIAEARIADAQQRGEFDCLPGAGKPLLLDDDRFVAPELRAAYRALKNAGCLPPELENRREIARIEDLLRALPTDTPAAELRGLLLRLNGLRAGMERCGRTLHLEAAYGSALCARLGAGGAGEDGS